MCAAEACSRYNGRPEGVTVSFQVRRHKIDPVTRCWSLFAKDDVKPQLAEDPVGVWPEVPGIGETKSLPRSTEGLAGAGTGRDASIFGPSGQSKGSRPYSDASEEMDLGVAAVVARLNIADRPLIDDSMRDHALFDQLAQPSGRVWVKFVVDSGHARLTKLAGRV